jgi:hypothetical protein
MAAPLDRSYILGDETADPSPALRSMRRKCNVKRTQFRAISHLQIRRIRGKSRFQGARRGGRGNAHFGTKIQLPGAANCGLTAA